MLMIQSKYMSSRHDAISTFFISLLAFLSVVWFLSQLSFDIGKIFELIFPHIYASMAFFGAISGIYVSSKWGGFKSLVGRALLFYSFGLLFQFFGQIVYSYYSLVSGIEIPYPSIGDIGFFGSIPPYIIATYFLSKACGSFFMLKQHRYWMIIILVPISLLALSYFIFLSDYKIGEIDYITIFLDFGYPLGQSIYIALALSAYLLSIPVLGGVMKSRVWMVFFALLLQYIADFVFLYKVNRGIWVPGGLNDYMYLLAYFQMAITLLGFNNIVNKNLKKS